MIQIDNDERDFRGTVWDRHGSPALAHKYPPVRFFYLDEDHPRCPTHIWWDGICLRLDQHAAFQVGPEHDTAIDTSSQVVALSLGRLIGLMDPEYTNRTLEQMLLIEQQVQHRAEEKYRDPSDRRRRDRRKPSW